MNSVGKTLVVLNFLFALVTGGLLIFSFAARTHWRDEAENRLKALKVAQASAQAYHDLAKKEVAERRKVEGAFDQAKINAGATESSLKAALDKIAADKKKADDAADAARLENQMLTKEAERLRKEVGHLTTVIADREKQIVVAQGEAARFRTEAKTQKDLADAAMGRVKNLLDRVKEMELAAARLDGKGGTGTGGVASVNNPNYSNPPPAYIKGTIEKIHSTDKNLFTISLGSDVGVKENHTMEIYRIKPSPDYLGRMLIVESHPRYAIGRLIRSASSQPIHEGDEVASKIRP
jgi:hypothetical protein